MRVAAFATEEGENLGDADGASLFGTKRRRAGRGVRDRSAKFHDAFAADLPDKETAVMTATQRPVAESAFSDPAGPPACKRLPSWAVVATGDKAAGADVIRPMAERAGAKITEVEGSHMIMISQPQVVTDVILEAVAAAG
jgi:pimeloyl-ACP methyl ester carboxylesterase